MSSDEHRPSGADQVAGALAALGVEGLFAAPSGHLQPLLEALDITGASLIEATGEAAAVHMADGYYRVTGKPGVALLGAGTSLAAALPAVAAAHQAGSALVVIALSPTQAELDRAGEEPHALAGVRPYTKFARRVPVSGGVQLAAPHVSAAINASTAGRPGVAYLQISTDTIVQRAAATPAALQLQHLQGTRRGTAAGDPMAVAQALDVLREARRPVAIVGSGAWHSRAFGALQRFLDLVRVPTFTVNMGRGAIPDDHPACFGYLFGPGASAVVDQADVALVLGTRLSHFLDFGRPPLLSPGCRIIQVDISPEQIGRERIVEAGITGDLHMVLERMSAALSETPDAWEHWKEWLEDLGALADESRTTLRALTESEQKPPHPLRLMAEVEELTGRKDVVVADGGDTTAFCAMVRGAYAPGTWLEGGPGGRAGSGVALAIGAQVGRPNQRVVLVTGDGALLSGLVELSTALRFELPLVVVVNDNGGPAMVRHGVRTAADNLGPPPGSPPPLLSWHTMAEAMGMQALHVDDPEALAEALEEAFELRRPALVHVRTDPDAAGPAAQALANLLRADDR